MLIMSVLIRRYLCRSLCSFKFPYMKVNLHGLALTSRARDISIGCFGNRKQMCIIKGANYELLRNFYVDMGSIRKSKSDLSVYPHMTCEAMDVKPTRLTKDIDADALSSTVVLFSGQGSQYIGMGKCLLPYPHCKNLCDTASEILGYDILEVCAVGPKEKLDRTEISQLVVFVLSLAAIEQTRIEHPAILKNCVATAGFSVGEISALVFAGAISFIEGLKLVKVRAKAMQAVSDDVASGMATVFYGADSLLDYACFCARQKCLQCGIEDPVCKVANYLFPCCRVIAGHLEAIEFIEQNASLFKLKRVKRLPVSGAFHTPIMKPAAEKLKRGLMNVKLSTPRIPVHSNINGDIYKDSSHILKQLPEQIYSPVKWEQTLNVLYKRIEGNIIPHTVICDPGTTLMSCLKIVNKKASNNCTFIHL